MYNNNYGGGYSRYAPQQYGGFPQQRQYSQPRQYGVYQQAAAPRKRSGAKMSKYTPTQGANKGQQQIIVNGWRKNRQGFTKFTAVTTKFSKDGGKGWIGSIFVTVTNVSTGQESKYWGTMQSSTGKVVIDALGIVMNPKAPNGGYCGTFSKNRSRR